MKLRWLWAAVLVVLFALFGLTLAPKSHAAPLIAGGQLRFEVGTLTGAPWGPCYTPAYCADLQAARALIVERALTTQSASESSQNQRRPRAQPRKNAN